MTTALEGGHAWWVAPTFRVASIGWRQLKRFQVKIEDKAPGLTTKNEVERRIEIPGKSGWVQVMSASDPDSLRGEGLDIAVLDETAFIKAPAWAESLRPALSDRLGKAIFISTPKGRNWFWHLYLRGQEEPEWEAWRFPTSSNPYIDKAEIEAARRNLPERIFKQEYEAEFLEDAGQVFRKVIDAATAEPRESGDGCVIGVDWGKHEDFTVVTVLDQDGRMVKWERFNQIDYTVQLGRLESIISNYRSSRVVAESNAMGEPLVEQLHRKYGNVTGFRTTNQSKATLIEDLALAFERGEVAIFNEPVLVNELQAFEMNRLPSGMIRYAAPQGMHDDTVISLALAWHGLRRLRPAVLERASNPFYG